MVTGVIIMKKIYKYTLMVTDEQTLELPLGSQLLCAKEQKDEVVVYALVNPTEENRENYKVLAYGTGHNIAEDLSDYSFLDTVLIFNGGLVFHFFYKRISL